MTEIVTGLSDLDSDYRCFSSYYNVNSIPQELRVSVPLALYLRE